MNGFLATILAALGGSGIAAEGATILASGHQITIQHVSLNPEVQSKVNGKISGLGGGKYSLRCEDCEFSAGFFSGLGRPEDLEEIQIANVRCNSPIALNEFNRFTSLASLAIERTPMDPESLAQLGHFQGIRAVRFDGIVLPDRPLFANMMNLQAVLLSSCAVTPRALLGIDALPRLETVSLSSVRGCANLSASISHVTHIKSLSIEASGLSDADMRQLMPFLGEVEYLSLRENPVQGGFADQPVVLSNVKVLSLSATAIKGEFFSHLRAFPHVDFLVAEDSGIGDAALEKIPEETTISSLALGGSKVTVKGLVNLLKIRHITVLSLRALGLTDSDLEMLSAADCRHLTGMNLSENFLCDRCVQSLLRFTAMREVNIQRNQMSPAGIVQLQSAMPALRIHR